MISTSSAIIVGSTTGGTRDQIYRVITTRPGNAATVVEVIAESTKTGKRSASNFFRSNRVEIVPREPQNVDESAAL
jgi:hypothetical protein